MTVNPERIAGILGGAATLHQRVRTPRELRKVVEGGLPPETLDHAIRHLFGGSDEGKRFKYQIVARTTLMRRRAREGAMLNAEESQRTERLARMIALAEQVFEEEGLARDFLTSAQPNLGGERPIDLITSDLGTREVEDILYGIEYSLPV